MAQNDFPVVTVSTRTLTIGVLLLAAAVMTFVLRDVLVTVFVALVLSASIDPFLTRLERHGVRRPLGLTLVVVGVGGTLVVLGATLLPILIEQLQTFSTTLPDIYRQSLERLRERDATFLADGIESAVRSMGQGASQAARGIFGGAMNAVRGALSAIGVVVLTLYMAMQQRDMKDTTLELLSPRWRPVVGRLSRQVKVRLGSWLRGQLLLSLSIGLASYFGLLALGVKFTVVLAVIAGISEFVPVIGPILGAVPAIIVAGADEPMKAVWVALLYVVIQQIENHVLVPRVMASNTGLSPVAVLVAVLVGAKLAGVLGVFLAVPSAIIVHVVIEDWKADRRLALQSRERGAA